MPPRRRCWPSPRRSERPHRTNRPSTSRKWKRISGTCSSGRLPSRWRSATRKPGPMPGFYEVEIRGSQGNASQEETFYISKDGQKIIRGNVFDIAQNPFKADLDKIKTEYQPSIGTPGAPVVLVEFSDFECPYCRQQAKMLREELLKAYPKEVRLYYLDFPLESLHPWAKSAAMIGPVHFPPERERLLGLSRLDFREPGRDHAGKSQGQGRRVRERKRNRCRSAFEMHRFARHRRGSEQDEERGQEPRHQLHADDVRQRPANGGDACNGPI